MKSYRLAGLLILALALAGFSSAAAMSPDKDCKPVGACQAQSTGASSLSCQTKCASACAGKSGQISDSASAPSCAAQCTSPCGSADCGDCTACGSAVRGGPRYRSIRSRESRCTCGSVACRLYGIRCNADKRKLERACGTAACTAPCPPGCTKPCCADKRVCMKKAQCPPGCTKPCCADREWKVMKIREGRCTCGSVACRLYGIRCNADKRKLERACGAAACTAPCPPGCAKPCPAGGERKVMKVRIEETGNRGERIIVKEIDSDSAEDFRWLDEEGEIIHISRARGAFLGVSVESVPQGEYDGSGVLVSEVHDGSPAEDLGLEAGDIILAVDGVDVQGPEDFVQEIRAREPGDEVTLEVVRDGRAMQLAVELGEREVLEMKKSARTVGQIENEIKELKKELEKMRKKLKELERN